MLIAAALDMQFHTLATVQWAKKVPKAAGVLSVRRVTLIYRCKINKFAFVDLTMLIIKSFLNTLADG